MPLKYLADSPLAVRITGLIHGILFIAFCILLIPAMRKLSMGVKAGVWGFVCSLLPFGTFVFDAQVRKRIAERGSEDARAPVGSIESERWERRHRPTIAANASVVGAPQSR